MLGDSEGSIELVRYNIRVSLTDDGAGVVRSELCPKIKMCPVTMSVIFIHTEVCAHQQSVYVTLQNREVKKDISLLFSTLHLFTPPLTFLHGNG